MLIRLALTRAGFRGVLAALPVLLSAWSGAALGQFGDDFKPSPLEVAAAFPAPRLQGNSYKFPVDGVAGGGLYIRMAPNPWRNSIVRIHMPMGDASPTLTKLAPNTVQALSYMRGPVLEELRTGNDGSLLHVMRGLPLTGMYQVEVITAGPTTAAPANGQITILPWDDIRFTPQLGKAYDLGTSVPGQQVVLSVPGSAGGYRGVQIWGEGMPVAVYLIGPDGSIVWRKTQGNTPTREWTMGNLQGVGPLAMTGTHQWVLVFAPEALGKVRVYLQ